jgi:hypothetical protein
MIFIFFFSQKCIEAIDGTYVDTNVTSENKVPYWDRKLTTTHNVLCMVDLDLCFTYVYVSREGSTQDSRVFYEWIYDPKVCLSIPTEGISS